MSWHTAHTDHGARSVLVRKVQTDPADNKIADDEKILGLEFDYTFGTIQPGDPARKVAIMVTTDSVTNSCVSLMARRRGCGDEYEGQQDVELR